MITPQSILLPIHEPVVNSFPPYAFRLSVLGCTFEDHWFLNHFVLIRSRLHKQVFWTRYDDDDFSSNPKLETHEDTVDLIDRYDSFLDFLTAYLSQQKYIQLELDNFYISCSDAYKKQHLFHPTLVYGYDIPHNLIYVADFYGGKYRRSQANLNDFLQAYKPADAVRFASATYPPSHNVKAVYIYSIHHDAGCAGLDRQEIANKLKRYITEPNITEVDGDRWTLGISLYNDYMEFLQACTSENQSAYIDGRGFHLLYEHKLIMSHRLSQLCAPAERLRWTESWQKIVQMSEALQNLIMKNNLIVQSRGINPSGTFLNKCLSLLQGIRESEYEFFHRFLGCV